MLENERLRLGELRKKHYEIAGVPLEQLGQDDSALTPTFPSSPKPSKPTIMKKPALAQKPNIPTKTMVRFLQTFFLTIYELQLFLHSPLIFTGSKVCIVVNTLPVKSLDTPFFIVE